MVWPPWTIHLDQKTRRKKGISIEIHFLTNKNNDMNKILILAAMFLYACSNPGEATNKEKDPSSTNEVVKDRKEDKIHQTVDATRKWKLDPATRQNMSEIRQLVSQSLGREKELADSLEKAKDKLIRECRMRGADHEALHLWLEDFMKDLERLKQDPSPVSVAALQKSLEEFDATFE